MALPGEYLELEYIEANGQQGTTLNINASPYIRCVATITPTVITGDQYIVGARISAGTAAYIMSFVRIYNSQFRAQFYASGKSLIDTAVSSPTPVVGQKYIVTTLIRSGEQRYYIDGTQKLSNWESFSANSYTVPITIFKQTIGNQSYGRIHHLTFEVNGTEVRDYTPCERISDKISGLYESYTDTFIPSETGIDFIHGPYVGCPVIGTIVPTSSGIINGMGTYQPGDLVTLNATPNNNFQFGYYIVDDDTEKIYQNPYSFTINQGTNILAKFFITKKLWNIQQRGNLVKIGSNNLYLFENGVIKKNQWNVSTLTFSTSQATSYGYYAVAENRNNIYFSYYKNGLGQGNHSCSAIATFNGTIDFSKYSKIILDGSYSWNPRGSGGANNAGNSRVQMIVGGTSITLEYMLNHGGQSAYTDNFTDREIDISNINTTGSIVFNGTYTTSDARWYGFSTFTITKIVLKK